jgi:hypothetical protein
MDSLIHAVAKQVRDADDHLYKARVLGRQRSDGTWIGWVEFSPRGTGVVRGARASRLSASGHGRPNATALAMHEGGP